MGYLEEVTALAAFPSETSEAETAGPPSNGLQCPKCLVTYGGELALREHMKHCHSTLGEEEEQNRQRRRELKTDGAINHLQVVERMYEMEIRRYVEVSKKLEDLKRELRRH